MYYFNRLVDQFGGGEDVFVCILLGFALLLANSFIKNNKKRFVTSTISSLFLTAEVFSLYLTQTFIGYQFYLHTNLRGIKGMESLFVLQIVITVLLFIGLVVLFQSAHFLWIKFKQRIKKSDKIYRNRKILMISLVLIHVVHGRFIKDTSTLLPILAADNSGNFNDVLAKHGMSDYVTPKNLKCTVGKNIIAISMESLENGFLHEKYAAINGNLRKLKENWAELNFLESSESYQSKRDYAHLGTMKISMKKKKLTRTTEFNWTDNLAAKSLVDEYRKIGTKYVWMFDITTARQNQPLESPRIMRALDSHLRRKSISDPEQMIPFLIELSEDERIPLISRNHASRLVKKIEESVEKKKKEDSEEN